MQANEADRKDAIKQAKGIFAFTLKNAAGEEDSWHIDLKNKGEVAKGAAPAGGKADVTLSLSDENFGKLVAGKTKAQQLFMSGKLKVKGNVMKGESQSCCKDPEAMLTLMQPQRWSPYCQRRSPKPSYRKCIFNSSKKEKNLPPYIICSVLVSRTGIRGRTA